MSQGIINVTLNRDGVTTPWGFRLHGGKDIGYPLTIQRVFLGSPSENELQRGDIILGISDQDVTGLTHMEAHDVIKSAGNQLRVLVHRLPGAPPSTFAPKSPVAKSNAHPLANAISTPSKQPSFVQPTTPKPNQPYRSAPQSWTPPQLPTCSSPAAGFQPVNPPKIQNIKLNKPRAPTQPYFMQKLPSKTYSPVPASASPVIPSSGAEDGPQLVNLQYNSPLGLYSKEALRETLKAQSTLHPKSRPKSPLPGIVTKPNPPVANQENPATPTTPGAIAPARPGTKLTNIVDITLSPTFQMIQEAENRSASPRPEAKTPPPMARGSPSAPLSYSPGGYQDPTVNAFGAPRETIHQSGSFKTLMATLAFSGNPKDL